MPGPFPAPPIFLWEKPWGRGWSVKSSILSLHITLIRPHDKALNDLSLRVLLFHVLPLHVLSPHVLSLHSIFYHMLRKATSMC